jgi:transposase-like protein
MSSRDFDQARDLVQLATTTTAIRNRYIQALRYEYSAREIGRQLGVSAQTVLNWTSKGDSE